MFFDWVAREGGAVFSWWLLTLLAGIAVFPLLYRLMSALPSRGYALMRAAGLMLVGFVFWMLNILGMTHNTPGATILAALIVFGVGVIAYVTWKDREPILPWLRHNVSLIAGTEILFAVLFIAWIIVRALNPSLVSTEKPMEMAFLSAIRHSATFPPNDPWMSGYAISYYHFGYIIMAMLGNMSGVSNGMNFNLAISLLFALTGLGAFGIAYDLVAKRLSDIRGALASYRRPAIAVGLLAAIFAVVMGNLGAAMVELPYETCTAPASYLSWINIDHRDSYPGTAADPTSPCNAKYDASIDNWNFWWWFDYSRVVRDYDIGQPSQPLAVQPITEFPQFSFVLSDMHPHVLALPFAMLCIALGFNLALRKRKLAAWEILLYGIFVGGMVFLNSWDGVYLVFIVAAEALRRLLNNGSGRYLRADWIGIIVFGVQMLLLTAVLYLPFFVSFRSQVQGIAPNLIWPTQFQQFFVMFGPFLVMIGVFLAVEVWRAGPRLNIRLGWQVIGSALVLLAVAMVFFIVVAALRPDVQGYVGQILDNTGGNNKLAQVISAIATVITRRVGGVVTEGVLVIAIFVVIARLFAREPHTPDGTPAEARHIITYSPSTAYALLMIASGAVLTLIPDFFYLEDGFGVRINTMFKLYYQGWVFWSVASAFALWSVLAESAPIMRRVISAAENGVAIFEEKLLDDQRVSSGARSIFMIAVIVLVGAGLVYPVTAVYSRAIKEADHSQGMTLDGAESQAASHDDYVAIECLASKATSDKDVVAEATQPHIAYNVTGDYGRVSGLTGIPTLMGWDNHEGQWRGSTFAQLNGQVDPIDQKFETRQETIAKLYNTTDWSVVQSIIKEYHITYIYVGPTERRDFDKAGIAKFDTLTPICQSGDSAAYSASSIGAAAPATGAQ